jgi:hypothetical protein
MAEKNPLVEQMLEHLVNGEQQKAEELFHEYVVSKSREIYEGLIESEIAEEEDKDEDEDEDMEEAAKDEDAEEDKVDENFEDIAIEADDEEADDMMGGDPTDDLEGELDAEMGDEGEESEEEMMQDLGDIIDELQAKFDALQGEEEEQGEFDGEEKGEEEMKDDFDLETVREYVEKVATPKGGDDGANAKSIVAGKNDMGGTSANIAKGAVESESASTKGGLLNPSAKEDNAGNINVPGGKAGNAFSKKEPGHGAEKKGAGENADNKQSLFRGRR